MELAILERLPKCDVAPRAWDAGISLPWEFRNPDGPALAEDCTLALLSAREAVPGLTGMAGSLFVRKNGLHPLSVLATRWRDPAEFESPCKR